MARAAMPAAVADILHSHPLLTFDVGNIHYSIQTDADQRRPGRTYSSRYSVNDAQMNLTFPLLWAFGTGRVGQSYLFKQQDGNFYEARVTYYQSLGNLGFTPFRALASPSSVEEAMYRPVEQPEVKKCFACHATASSVGGRFDEDHLTPGVTCEACHGAGAEHVTAMNELIVGKPASRKPSIFNSAHLAPADAVDYCGACHGTFWDVKLSGIKGVSTTRSAPYRLVTSRCWGKGDARLTCTACHDPHEQLQRDAAAYDKACLSCHLRSSHEVKTVSRSGAACPVSTTRCTSCHMPKTYVPEMHDNFTDHRIRVVRAGETFPD